MATRGELLNLNAYRFSIAWPRIYPQGVGLPNQSGPDHYDRLVDALLEANLAPFVSLNHWDLPQDLQEKGLACDDRIGPDGAVDDSPRLEYLQAHIAQAARSFRQASRFKVILFGP